MTGSCDRIVCWLSSRFFMGLLYFDCCFLWMVLSFGGFSTSLERSDKLPKSLLAPNWKEPSQVLLELPFWPSDLKLSLAELLFLIYLTWSISLVKCWQSERRREHTSYIILVHVAMSYFFLDKCYYIHIFFDTSSVYLRKALTPGFSISSIWDGENRSALCSCPEHRAK